MKKTITIKMYVDTQREDFEDHMPKLLQDVREDLAGLDICNTLGGRISVDDDLQRLEDAGDEE